MDDVLRRAPLFRELDDEAAAALRASMVEVKLARGEVLFREGDEGDRVYVVIAGKIKLGRTSPDGRENLLALLGPSQMFGELSLFDPGPRSATVTAVTDTTLLGLGHTDLLPWLTGRPEVARGLLSAIRAAVAAVQRHPRRSRLLRRARPSGQAAAGSVDPFRSRLRRRCSRRARSHPGRAGAACGSVARDRQQGARRLRRARMVAARAAFGRAARH